MPDTTPTTHTPSSRHQPTLNSLGVIILLLGLAAAGIIYWTVHTRSARQSSHRATSSLESGDWHDTTLSREDSKRSNRDIELYYGKLGLLVVRLQDWFAEPDSWAIIIATISILTALALFLFANRTL